MKNTKGWGGCNNIFMGNYLNLNSASGKQQVRAIEYNQLNAYNNRKSTSQRVPTSCVRHTWYVRIHISTYFHGYVVRHIGNVFIYSHVLRIYVLQVNQLPVHAIYSRTRSTYSRVIRTNMVLVQVNLVPVHIIHT